MGVLYFGDGELFEVTDAIIEVKQFPEERGLKIRKLPHEKYSVEFTINTNSINRNALLSLWYGREVSNNWLKMHGGIMTRKKRR